VFNIICWLDPTAVALWYYNICRNSSILIVNKWTDTWSYHLCEASLIRDNKFALSWLSLFGFIRNQYKTPPNFHFDEGAYTLNSTNHLLAENVHYIGIYSNSFCLWQNKSINIFLKINKQWPVLMCDQN